MWEKYKKIDLDLIKEELNTLPEYDKQIYLQGKEIGCDPISENYLDIDNREHEYNIPLYKIHYINELMKRESLTRTRVMRLPPKYCYYWHNDKTKRLHISIKTNPHCFLLIDGVQFHLPADGYSYIIDTTKMHTALNASKHDRIHIVGVFK